MTDIGLHRIQVLTAEGKFVRMIGKYGNGRGELDSPITAAVGVNGVVYVSERDNHCISVFDSKGQFVTSFGSKGDGPMFNNPRGLAVDNSGVVCVCDSGSDRIQLF